MDQLASEILDKLENSNQPLSVQEFVTKCKKTEHEVKECLKNLSGTGIIKLNHQGLWVLSTHESDDLCQDAECFEGSLSDIGQEECTSLKVPMETQTEIKSPVESTNIVHDTVPKESSQYSNSPNPSSDRKANPANNGNHKVPNKEALDANFSFTPYLKRESSKPGTLSGTSDDLSRQLEATNLKEPTKQEKRVVPYDVKRSVIPRQNSNQTTVIEYGDGGIQTREQVQLTQVSKYDPNVDPHKSILDRIVELFSNERTERKRPLEVAKLCIGQGASKKDINRYLHHLKNAGYLDLKYQKGNSDPVYSASKKIIEISDERITELAVELGKTSKRSDTGSELVARAPGNSDNRSTQSSGSTPCYVKIDNHYHQHTHHHQNYIQVGDNNTVNLSDVERIAEEEVDGKSS